MAFFLNGIEMESTPRSVKTKKKRIVSLEKAQMMRSFNYEEIFNGIKIY